MDKFFENTKIRSLLLVYIGTLLLLAIVSELQFVKTTKILDDDLVLILCNLTVIIWVLFKSRRSKVSIKEKIANLRYDLKIKDIILSFFINVALSVGILGTVAYVTAHLWPSVMDSLFKEINETEASTLYATIIYVISAAFIAPVAEELMFRGIILNRLKVKFGVKKAVIISSVLFGLIHFDLAVLPAVIFGICMAIIYLKTKNIFATIAIHLINNMITSSGQVVSFFSSNGGMSQGSNITINDINLLWLIGGIIAIVASIIMSYYFLKANKVKS